ncbi:MAG TPA: TMEM175 family protein [Xanthomonadaceae bacterium]|nr:TMEM175 family protein [Xanthomonadaceae bacterium]
MNETVKLRPDGFRERGGDVTRLEAFVDAAFAFALTMLVISVGTIPDSTPKLIDALKGTPAFAACFAQIAIFWYAHVTWSRRYGLDDPPSVVLSLVMVFLVMVYIYPLKALFAAFFSWISGGWLPIGFELKSMQDLRTMFIVYAVVFGTMGIVFSLLYLQAWRQRDALELSLDERVATATYVARWLVSPAVATVSVIAALNLPDHAPSWATGTPGLAYLLMLFDKPLPNWFGRRVRKRLLSAGNT